MAKGVPTWCGIPFFYWAIKFKNQRRKSNAEQHEQIGKNPCQNGQTHRLPLQLQLEREQYRTVTLHFTGQNKLE